MSRSTTAPGTAVTTNRSVAAGGTQIEIVPAPSLRSINAEKALRFGLTVGGSKRADRDSTVDDG